MGMNDQFWVNGDMHILFNNGAANAVRLWNTPTAHNSKIRLFGIFAQDTWSYKKLTLNVGVRVDHSRGWMPEQSKAAGTFSAARDLAETDVFSSWRGAWRTGVVYDLFGSGRTAIKASASRYAAQVGLNMVQRVHPLQRTSGTRPWTDTNGDRQPQESELGTFSGFPGQSSRYTDEHGPDWPYSDEFTAGIEHEIAGAVRVGATYYHRTNRQIVGSRNVLVPPTAYTEHSIAVPGGAAGPGGDVRFYNLIPAFNGLQDNVFDNQDALDTTFNGVEITASKRLRDRWQLLAGLTLGKNEGGVLTGDLNDPNNALNFPQGIEGTDSAFAFRLSGSYVAPYGINVSGSVILNDGYPYQSAYAVTRTVFPSLTRSSQTVRLTRRGDERLPDVAMVDFRLSRTFRVNDRRITPMFEIFNLSNADTVVGYNANVGSSYLRPTEILSPRLLRLGISFDF